MYLLIEFWRDEYKIIAHNKDITILEAILKANNLLNRTYFIISAIDYE